MWKLHRYYLKELAVNAAITFVVVFAVVLVSVVPRALQKSISGELYEAALTTLLLTVDSFPHLLTIAFLIAVVLTYSRAAQDRELTAVRAAGISPFVAMTSALLAGIVLSVAGSLAMHYAIPEVHYRRFRFVAEAFRNVVTNFKLNSDRIRIPGNEDCVLTYRRREGGYFLDCTLYCPPDKSIVDMASPIIKVDRVSLPNVSKHGDIIIDLEGVHDPFDGSPRGTFTLVLDLDKFADRNRRPDQNEDLQSDHLLAEVLRNVHPRPNDAIYVLFRRCCFALMPALLAPIGFCLAELTRERGRVMALVFALVPLAVFYFGDMMGARLMFGTDNPWYAWLPAVLLAVIGAPLCWRQMRR